MGIMSDVLIPIEALITPAEQLPYELFAGVLRPMLYNVNAEAVDIQLRALATAFQPRG
jgi:hypothetical protein